MTGNELRAMRKEIACTQHELAARLGVSRKTIITWEASDDPLDSGVALQVQKLAGQIRVVENVYWVDRALDGSYAVIRRRIQDIPTRRAASYMHAETMLYGVFKQRVHAYRWSAALQATADPRNTRKLIRERAAEIAMRDTENRLD